MVKGNFLILLSLAIKISMIVGRAFFLIKRILHDPHSTVNCLNFKILFKIIIYLKSLYEITFFFHFRWITLCCIDGGYWSRGFSILDDLKNHIRPSVRPSGTQYLKIPTSDFSDILHIVRPQQM